MRIAFASLMTLVFLIWAGVSVYEAIELNRNMSGHLKRAADANTVELARKEMEKAVAYLERNNLTTGYTSILYTTPDEDIEFWYTNLKASLEELRRVPENASQLERSNVLMKLRETLLDQGESTSITIPSGLSIYPFNTLFAVWGWLSFILTCVLWVVVILYYELY